MKHRSAQILIICVFKNLKSKRSCPLKEAYRHHLIQLKAFNSDTELDFIFILIFISL